MPETRIRPHPGVIDLARQIPRVGNRRAGKIERLPPARREHDLDLIRVGKIRRRGEPRGQRRHVRRTGDQLRQRANLPRRNQRLIRLHVDHVVGTDATIGLRQTIRATGVVAPRHDRLKSRRRHAFRQKLMIHSEIQRHLRSLAGDTFGHPKQQRLALDHVQEFAREAGGLESTRDDQRNFRHRVAP